MGAAQVAAPALRPATLLSTTATTAHDHLNLRRPQPADRRRRDRRDEQRLQLRLRPGRSPDQRDAQRGHDKPEL